MLTLPKRMNSHLVFSGVRVTRFLCFMCNHLHLNYISKMRRVLRIVMSHLCFKMKPYFYSSSSLACTDDEDVLFTCQSYQDSYGLCSAAFGTLLTIAKIRCPKFCGLCGSKYMYV